MKKFLLLSTLIVSLSAAAKTSFRSSSTGVTVIELFTSEGCSSCPPADRAFSNLRGSSELWKFVVPMAFHVDYWNNLGWVDPMSSQGNSYRQRAYGGTVATPAFKVNGQDVSGLGSVTREAGGNLDKVGVVEVERLGEKKFRMTYTPASTSSAAFEGNLALLGFGIVSQVTSGENAGNTFTHDFVVLSHERISLKPTANGKFSAVFDLQNPRVSAAELGLGAWVSSSGLLKPIQATGGMLKDLEIRN